MTEEERKALLNEAATAMVNIRMDVENSKFWGNSGDVDGAEAYEAGFDDGIEACVQITLKMSGKATDPDYATKDEVVAEARRQMIRWRGLLNRLPED